MKKITFILVISILFFNISCKKEESFEETKDKVVSSYYPLLIGNKWIYDFSHTYSTDFLGPSKTAKGFIQEEIIKDTVFEGMMYYVLKQTYTSDAYAGEKEYYDYLRYERDSLKLYRWGAINSDRTISGDYLIDDFSAPLDSVFIGHHFETGVARWDYHVHTKMIRESDTLLFNKSDKIRTYQELYYWSDINYTYMNDIGLIEHNQIDEYNRYNYKLIGCVLKDTIFGDVSKLD